MDQAASAQVIQAFRSLAPYMDTTLKLAPNPGATKRPRVNQGTDRKDHRQKDDEGEILPAMQLMARMVINMDRDWQMLKREDTFVLFFNNQEPTGSLKMLLETATTWHQQAQQDPSLSLRTPLRQKLVQTLMIDLMDRIQKLLEAKEGSDLLNSALQSSIILPNKTFPYMEWNPTTRSLQVSNRPPLSVAKLHQHCTELLDMFKDASVIQRFHALPVKEGSNTSPWRLQLCLRDDRPWQLMQSLNQSSVWTLMAMSLKQHSRYQSPLANRLEQALGMTPSTGSQKGRGKGKNQQKGKQLTQTTKSETK